MFHHHCVLTFYAIASLTVGTYRFWRDATIANPDSNVRFEKRQRGPSD
ncbi:protein of unknown function [Shinella sp. WSC3-e]|nr:hypothetical protein SHINE37_40036 [Rhizobiaceae bacterium]CAK7254728.1 protein of unknown function [Shinella sp. WSC3-e]